MRLTLKAFHLIVSLGLVGCGEVLQPVVSMEKYNRVQSGMSYSDVVGIMGSSGQEVSSSDMMGITTKMYVWQNPSGSNMNAMFQNDRLINEAQAGLH